MIADGAGSILHRVKQLGLHFVANPEHATKAAKVLLGLPGMGFQLIASTPNWRRHDKKLQAHVTYELLFRKIRDELCEPIVQM